MGPQSSQQLAVLEDCAATLVGFVEAFEPQRWTGPDAAMAVKAFVRIERLAGAGRTLAAGQVQHSNRWRAEGYRSPEEWLAHQQGTTPADAARQLATAHNLQRLPATDRALRGGQLSPEQAALVAAGAAADPTAEHELLGEAATSTVAALRRRSDAVRAAARGPQSDTDRQHIHNTRHLRHWTAVDGAFEGRFRLTPDHGALLVAALQTHRDAIFEQARGAGRRDHPDAYQADALVEMARTTLHPTPEATREQSPPAVTINIRVDHRAYQRGYTEPGETCQIDGIGPIPVTVARRLGEDATTNTIVVDGPHITDITHHGRTIPARLRTALVARDPVCVVPGCDHLHHLEIHHLAPFADGGPTTIDNLARICTWHHDQITYHGAQLTGPHPHWRYQPPPPAGNTHPPGEPDPATCEPFPSTGEPDPAPGTADPAPNFLPEPAISPQDKLFPP